MKEWKKWIEEIKRKQKRIGEAEWEREYKRRKIEEEAQEEGDEEIWVKEKQALERK